MDKDQDNISPDLLATLVNLPELPPAVHDPDLPVPTLVDDNQAADPIPFTAPTSPMKEGEEPNFLLMKTTISSRLR